MSRILKFKKIPNPYPVSNEISDICEISDLLLFISHFCGVVIRHI